jgi:predicted ATPase/class 3 adenylate cyclase
MADLPRGTVAFLFTDVEDSTAAWERDHEAMQHAVERYLAILRETAAAHGGALYKTVGDGTQAAFTTAGDVLAAALAAQRALRAEPWPDPPGPLRVRMALHAGEAVPRDGDYLAAPLNRLARLLGIAAGGQILLTEAVQLLGHDDLPPGASLLDLGEIPLRDLERAERVFALVHPELPDAAAVPALTAQPTRHFPASLTPFLGRETEIAAILALLEDADVRQVTLTGPGGIGKTRLALEVGRRLAPAYPHGAVFVDLAAVRDPALVLPAIAAALGVRAAPARPLADVVHEELAERHLLLILDNFEQLLAAAPLAAELLAAAPGVKLLVTSRAPLRLRGEHVYPVPTLPLPTARERADLAALAANEAVALFVDRAQAVRPDFAVTSALAPVIAEICARLDGLPLAIELAAARLKLLPPRALLARLEQRLPLLTGGPRDAPARQQTLRDAIAWSYDLLTPDEQALFARLGIFVGGFTLDAADQVLGVGSWVLDDEAVGAAPAVPDPTPNTQHPAPNTLDLLASLVDASLVRHDGTDLEPRFAMLETIHEFALERLRERPAEHEALATSHAAWFLAFAEEACAGLVGARQGELLARLDADAGNIRAALDSTIERGSPELALRFARALWRYWLSRGRLLEGRDRLERSLALAGAPDVPAAIRADAHNALGNLLGDSGEHELARQQYELALALRRTTGDQEGIAGTLNNLGIIAFWRGDYDGATALHEESRALREAQHDPFGLALSLSNLGDVLLARGEFDRARELQTASLRLREQAGDAAGAAFSIYNLGEIARLEGDLPEAKRRLADSAQRFALLGDRIGLAYAECSLADLASREGDAARAADLLARVLRTRVEIGDKRGTLETMETIALAALRAGDDAAGLRLLGATRAQREPIASPVPPVSAASHERDLDAARARLGADGTDAALAAGRALDPEHTIALARETLDRLATLVPTTPPTA